MGFDLFCPFSVSYMLEHTRGKTQTSVRFILTRACDGVTIYDSGKLTQVLPAYPLAAALSPRTRYRLTIHAETDANERAEAESWFETGKMDEPWHAQWIGAADDCTSFCAETQILVSNLKRAQVKGGWIMLIDCGANTDCKPQYLQQFGVMASAYMQSVMGVKNPRISLLNNGEEAEKGCELTKAAYKLLSAAPINFAGNCEAREVLSGEFDALVCDGFVGNVVLKYTEGLASSMMAMLKTELTADFKSKIGAALSMGAFRRFKKKMDYKEVGGAPLLGINGCVIKAHGSSDAKAFASAIRQAELFVKGNVNPKIAEAIASLPDEE